MSDRNMEIRGALSCYIEGQSKYLCFANLFNEERNARNREEYIRNRNSDYQEFGAVSSTEKFKTDNYNKKIYSTKTTENVKSGFDNWCKNRREYAFRYTENQINKCDDDPILKAMTTETKKDNLSRKSSNNKNEYKEISFEPEGKHVCENGSTVRSNMSFKIETRSDKFLEQLSTKVHVCAAKDEDKNEFKNVHKEKKKCSSTFNQNQANEHFLESIINEARRIEFEKPTASKEFFPSNKSFNENSKEKSHSTKKQQRSIHGSSNYVYTLRNDHSFLVKKNTILCVRITNENTNNFFEITTDSMTILGKRKTLPELSANLPDVNSECKVFNYSAEAMNVILRFAFCSSRIPLVPVAVGIEVLVIAQSWDMKVFYKLFQEHFLQNVLTFNNVNLVFCYAYHYNLKDICDACKDIAQDKIILNSTVHQKRERKCRISIFTHVEPLEMSIPFEPVEAEFSNSFRKEIANTFTFKVVSGCFKITGFQIHLNKKHVSRRFKTEEKFAIDYYISKLNGTQEMTFDGTVNKPMRSLMTVFFTKELILNPKDSCEIFITAEIEPFMCSASANKNISVKNAVGELNLTIESNRRMENSNRKFILVGSFYYHVTDVHTNSNLINTEQKKTNKILKQ